MIGTPASLENTRAALAAGITSIGNLGQFFAFEPPGGFDDAELTRQVVRAIGAMAATDGTLVHSYLDDGPAMQFEHYGRFLGWAALELYVVEDLLGARLAHSYGGLIPEPLDRAAVGFALDDLRGRDSIGTMVYGNTVDYTSDHVRNTAVLATTWLVDIGAQLHRPTGHAINPVPLTEAERSRPRRRSSRFSCSRARSSARPARRAAHGLDEARAPRGARLADDATRFRDHVLARLQDAGTDVRDAGGGAARAAAHRAGRLEPGVRPAPADAPGDLEGGVVAREAERIARATPPRSTAPACCSPCSRSTT